MEIFGFEIKKREKKEKQLPSFVPPQDDGESTVIAPSSGYYGHYLNLDSEGANTEKELIKKYREISLHAECESAINDIVNESLVFDNDSAVYLDLGNIDLSEKVKKQIYEEFNNVLSKLNFNQYGHEFFRRWYIDGKLYFHLMVDSKKETDGIQDIRYIDPLHIKKIKEVEKEKDPRTGVEYIKNTNEYFVYSNNDSNTNIKVSKDSIVSVTSGYTDSTRSKVISHLHKAIKPINQLRMLEDSLVIYRLARAPERRIFYIDVGNLPKGKAEEYLREVMSKYRNKMVYDVTTGEAKDEKKHMSMLEDFWLPRREGSRGTEISTLAGGESLGQIEDVLFFQKRLYKALNVPISRLDSESGFSLGRASEISRDELKFQKFINQLRKRFSNLFIDILKIQLLTKRVITHADWNKIKESIYIQYSRDNHFTELKNSEILQERFRLLADVESYTGNYFSKEWVQKNILMMSDKEIEDMKKQIEAEKKSGELPDDDSIGGF